METKQDNQIIISDDDYTESGKIVHLKEIYSDFDVGIEKLTKYKSYIDGIELKGLKKLYKSSGYIFLNQIIYTDIILRHVNNANYKYIEVPIAFYTNSIWSPNYCHFLFEEIVKMLNYQSIDSSIPIICNYNNTYCREYLEIFGIKNPIIPRSENVIIKCPNIIHFGNSTEYIISKYCLHKIYDILKQRLDYSPFKFNTGIVIKRNEWERTILNHDEFMTSLNHNFSNINWIVFDGTLTIKQSMELFNKTDYVIGSQGSGFVNTIYCRNGAKLFKIIAEPFNLTGMYSFNQLYPNFEKEYYTISVKFSPEQNGRHYRLNLEKLIPILKKYIN